MIQVEEEQYRATRAQLMGLMTRTNQEQAWFWTEEWQRGEREVDRDVAAGVRRHGPMTGEEFIASLEAMMAESA